MKILIDARLYGLEHAGLGRYTMNLVEELAKLDRENSYTVFLRKKYYQNLRLPNNWEKLLVDIHHYSVDEQIKLPGIINSANADLVHFPHFNVPVLYKGPFVVTIHDMLMHKFTGKETTTLPFYKYFLKRLFYRAIFRRAVKEAEIIIVPTKYVKEEVCLYFKIEKNKIIVTYEGFDQLKVAKGEKVLDKYKLKRPYLIYVGNAYPHKNLDIAIQAIIHLNKALKKKMVFAIATARGVFYDRLRKKVKDLGAEKFVRLLGFVPDDDLGALLASSTAFIYPSLSEGFGLQGIEAMAAGTPLIASDIPVFKEVYQDNAIYFDPKDYRSIAKALDSVIELGNSERDKIINKGKEFIKRYAWDKMAKQTLMVYKNSY